MPDDDRTRRRLGDETKGRIADLASGWSVESDKPARGDETNARIADLASGWTVDTAKNTADEPPSNPEPLPPPPSPGEASPPGRKKQKTLPPPPPGSKARKDLEAAIVESKTPVPAKGTPGALRAGSAPTRAKPPTAPPPVPPAARSAIVKSGPTETGTVNISGVIGTTGPIPRQQDKEKSLPGLQRTMTPKVISSVTPAPTPKPVPTTKKPLDQLALDESGEATEVDPGAHLTVPVGEFDQGGTHLDKDKLRVAYEQSTMKRDPANALLGLPEQPQTVVKAPSVEILLGETAAQLTRGDVTSIDQQTAKFERGDPTAIGGDSTTIMPTDLAPGAGGKLRAHAALRRKRGIGGDLRYVVTVLFGVRRARRELMALEQEQALRQKSRARHLLTLGRAAVGSEGYDHPALAKARESLAVVEDERAQHAAQVSAADSELLRVRNDRAEKAKAYAERMSALDAELAEVTKKLEPLEKESGATTRKATELQESLRRIDAQIAATEASKVAVKQRMDPAAIQAEIASLKADRIAVTRDEPRIAAELDTLNPRIAALEARRTEARKKRIELEDDEKKDQGRVQELLAAIGAKRKVVDRAAADAEELRDKILLELGERIYVDRPPSMQFELAPIDAIDVELGVTDRRIMELKEILSSVDKVKLARGIALIILILAALGTLGGWLFYEFS